MKHKCFFFFQGSFSTSRESSRDVIVRVAKRNIGKQRLNRAEKEHSTCKDLCLFGAECIPNLGIHSWSTLDSDSIGRGSVKKKLRL